MATKPKFKFRQATGSDAPEVASLIGEIWTHHFGYSVPPEDVKVHLENALAPATIKTSIEDDNVVYIIAESLDDTPSTTANNDNTSESSGNGMIERTTSLDQKLDNKLKSDSIAGVIQLIFGPTEPCLTLPSPVELNRLYIRNHHQGSGLAQALMEEAEEAARGRGGKSLWLGVWEDNPRGQRFYEKMGFKTVGEHSFLVGQNVRRDLVMEKPIYGL